MDISLVTRNLKLETRNLSPVTSMNLYIFNESSRAAVYGIGTYIRELTVALKDSDLNICVIHLRSEKTDMEMEETDGIRHWHIPASVNQNTLMDWNRQNGLYCRNVVYLLRLQIKDTDKLVFHLNYIRSGQLAEELSNVFDTKIVIPVHGSDWASYLQGNLSRLRIILNEEYPDNFGEQIQQSVEQERSLYTKVDRVVCLSEHMRKVLCRDYRIDLDRIVIVPNGLSDTGHRISDTQPIREKWMLSENEKIVLFAGRLDEVKGLTYLIKAFREVLKKIPYSRLLVVGSGNYDTCMLEAKDICTKITFTGLLEKEKLYELYMIADAGVMPSLFEPFGYVAVEMMMHGLPVVATATSGLNEVVDDTCGLKIPLVEHPENVEIDASLLAQKILYLLQHPAEARKMGQNGRKRYLKHYSSEVFGKNMVQLYESLFQSS